MSKVLEKTSALTKSFAPKNEANANKLKNTPGQRRLPGRAAWCRYSIGLKFVSADVRLLHRRRLVAVVKGFSQNAIDLGGGRHGLCFWLPDMSWGTWREAGSRRSSSRLPDVLDMMVVCVEAGLGLDQAMRKVSDEMKTAYPILAAEFAITNFQLQMGRTAAECLARSGRADRRGRFAVLAAVLIQADKFGSSISQALRVQSESMRTRRRQMAEEKSRQDGREIALSRWWSSFSPAFSSCSSAGRDHHDAADVPEDA